MFVGVASAVTQLSITAPLSEKFGQATMLAIGMAITVVCIGLQPFSPMGTTTIILMSLSAIGQSVAWPNVSALISETADPHRQGQILGLNNAMGALARVVGPQCAGATFPLSIHAPFIQGAVMVVPAIFLAIGAGRRARAWREAQAAQPPP
jgi:MFS family permease